MVRVVGSERPKSDACLTRITIMQFGITNITNITCTADGGVRRGCSSARDAAAPAAAASAKYRTRQKVRQAYVRGRWQAAAAVNPARWRCVSEHSWHGVVLPCMRLGIAR